MFLVARFIDVFVYIYIVYLLCIYLESPKTFAFLLEKRVFRDEDSKKSAE